LQYDVGATVAAATARRTGLEIDGWGLLDEQRQTRAEEAVLNRARAEGGTHTYSHPAGTDEPHTTFGRISTALGHLHAVVGISGFETVNSLA
jgi:hypothetical protein